MLFLRYSIVCLPGNILLSFVTTFFIQLQVMNYLCKNFHSEACNSVGLIRFYLISTGKSWFILENF